MSAARTRARAVHVQLLIACATLSACNSREPEPTAVPPAPALEFAPALPALQRVRLEYLFAAGERLAREWPALAGPAPCMVLVAQDAQWAVGCERAPFSDPVQLPERFRDRPVYARAGTRLVLPGQPATSCPEWLARVAASTLLAPATPAPRPGQLPAGTAVVAIGIVEGIVALNSDFRNCTTDEWLSVALHEWLHAWQLVAPGFAGERRALEDGSLAPAALRALYTADAGYRDAVQREYRLLERAARRTLDPAAARRELRAWSALQRARAGDLCARPDGAALLRADRVFTYLEGLGRYVESRFLVDPALRPERELLDDPEFGSFHRYRGGGYEVMQNRQLDPDYPYAIGFHLALLLDRVDPTWRARVHVHDGLLLGLAHELASSARAPDPAAPPPPCR